MNHLGILILGWMMFIQGIGCTANAQDSPAKPAEQKSEKSDAAEKTDHPFPNRFDAPALTGGKEWFNVDKPLDWERLKGKVVLIDFWTYCCINCMHVLPDLEYLEKKYANELVVIGVHSAKFENEKDSAAIRNAIQRYEIRHPVVNDHEMKIWRQFEVRSWPTLVIVDPEGKYIGYVSGEGNRELLDSVVAKLIDYHRGNGTLNETPFQFDLELDALPPTPLRFPGKVLADEASNRLFIADSNHNRIVMTDLDGKLQDIIGTGAIGAQDGSYSEAQFFRPQGMEILGDSLYVADTENHLLRKVDLKNKTVSTLAGTGQQARFRASGGPLLTTALNSPWAISHLKGTLYIAMAGPHQLWKHKLNSPTVEVFAGSGREDITDGPLSAGALAQPSGIVNDGQSLYFVDSEGSAIRQIELTDSPVLKTIAGPHDLPYGRSLFEFGDIDGKGDKVRFQHPIGLAIHDGALYVTDSYNHKIRKVNLQDSEVSTFLGTGKPGRELTGTSQFSEPAGATATSKHLYIADTNNHRIVRVDWKTSQAEELQMNGLEPPNISND